MLLSALAAGPTFRALCGVALAALGARGEGAIASLLATLGVALLASALLEGVLIAVGGAALLVPRARARGEDDPSAAGA